MANTAIQTAVKQKSEIEVKKKDLNKLVEAMAPAIKKALPSVITPERFTRMVLSAISSNPKLAACDGKSFLGAMMQAAQLGLEPNTPLGQAYIIPYGNQAQFQIGYKGLIDLAYRSGEVTIVDAQIVYEHDEFEYELGLDPKLKHKPALKDRGNPILYYAMFRTKEGGFGFQVMSIDDIRKHAQKFSKSFSSGPWQSNFDEMAKKTVLKKALKYAPLKSDFAKAVAADETIKTAIEEDMADLPSEVVFTDAEYVEVVPETGEVKEPANLFEEVQK